MGILNSASENNESFDPVIALGYVFALIGGRENRFQSLWQRRSSPM